MGVADFFFGRGALWLDMQEMTLLVTSPLFLGQLGSTVVCLSP